MNGNIPKLITLALLPAALLTFAACSTMEGVEKTTVIEMADGAIIVDTFTTTATVTGIDAAKRKVTMVTPGGSMSTYKAGPEVVNFAQIQIGDQVKAVVTEEVAIYIGSGAPPSATSGIAVAFAPLGAKPGRAVVETAQVTVKVTAVDAAKHKVTFQLPDGTTKKVKVGSKVDLSTVQPGDNVTVQVSEGLAITVEKP
jgi:hypothetical protein